MNEKRTTFAAESTSYSMMNRLFLLTISLLIVGINMWAGPVDEEQAQQEAVVFLNGLQAGSRQVRRAPVENSSLSAAKTGSSAYYIFNVSEKGGFVIVSAEDSTEPILGYVEKGSFDMDDIPENMKEWLKEYERQIAWARENGIERKATPRRAAKATISPMTTSKWNQRRPYNLYCYNETGDWYAVTGCVATAMAQIMYYHRCPKKTTVEIPAYDINYKTTETTYTYTWEAQPATTFEWTKMQDTYSSASSLTLENATESEKAVAKLMRYCGQAVKMRYSNGSSGASSSSASTAFSKYFGYDEDVRLVKRASYSNQEEWDDLIYNELANGRPVMYGGSNDTSGHAFIVDGYKDGMFSINWGWSGKHDGYFLLSALNPNDEGEAGTSSGGYNSKQDAIIGIQKPDGIDEADRRLTINSFTPDADYDCVVDYNVENNCGIEGTYDYAVAAIDGQGNVKKVLTELGSSTSFGIETCYKGSAMPQRTAEDTEDYVITLVCRLTGESTYKACVGWEANRLIAKPEHQYSNAFTITEYAEGTVTDIRDCLNEADNGIWYNLNGVRVEQPTRGVYIRNGKKVVTK